MKVLLVNPPYQTLTSNLGVGHQVPLGLLAVGGALLDDGHRVRLLDAECGHRSIDDVARIVADTRPDVVLTGHAGSTPAHPTCMAMLEAVRRARPLVRTVYGGVFPTYHAERIVESSPAVDVVVRGEGEATARALVDALARGDDLATVEGITFRRGDRAVRTPDRPPIRDLDAWRVGWELIEDWSPAEAWLARRGGDDRAWDRYRCFGLGRAAIVQWSRGCPHRCTYCGQHDFWVRWRRRDPERFADEVETLCREHGVRFFTLADENPTTLQDEWRRLLETLAARRLPARFFATIRATDIARDADMIDLYRDAGILYVLMGIESTDEQVLREVRKGSTNRDDRRACDLLREAGIFSIIGHIVGLGDESFAGLRRARRILGAYDGDYLNAMYVTPHDWTPFAAAQRGRGVVQPDQRRWDYRHQILAEPRLRPWQLFLAVKWLETWFHLRPRRLRRLFVRGSAERRRQALWCQAHTFAVWLGEIVEFAWTRRTRRPRPMAVDPDPPMRRPVGPMVGLTVSGAPTGGDRPETAPAGASELESGPTAGRSGSAPARCRG